MVSNIQDNQVAMVNLNQYTVNLLNQDTANLKHMARAMLNHHQLAMATKPIHLKPHKVMADNNIDDKLKLYLFEIFENYNY